MGIRYRRLYAKHLRHIETTAGDAFAGSKHRDPRIGMKHSCIIIETTCHEASETS